MITNLREGQTLLGVWFQHFADKVDCAPTKKSWKSKIHAQNAIPTARRVINFRTVAVILQFQAKRMSTNKHFKKNYTYAPYICKGLQHTIPDKFWGIVVRFFWQEFTSFVFTPLLFLVGMKYSPERNNGKLITSDVQHLWTQCAMC
uniref:Uncharacterized protein n=1 Tax=Lotharella oceanica TaxID=641309 RepID=A0A7S2U343_9EUKA|mmetsp:Transcript_7554/g.14777  ORF Transcript_7554/g.14777 Transcript_7554/m.14777 type:complete len:146 (+) Transcript_7554:564-1001(+)